MKKILLSAVLSFFLSGFGALPLGATVVYVYQTGNYTPVQTTFNIYRITFEADSLVLLTEANRLTRVAVKDFNYFRFYRTPKPTAVEEIETSETPIRINADNGYIYVSSAQIIRQLILTGVDGKVLAELQPNDGEVAFPIGQLPEGTYIIMAKTANHNTSKKFNKK